MYDSEATIIMESNSVNFDERYEFCMTNAILNAFIMGEEEECGRGEEGGSGGRGGREGRRREKEGEGRRRREKDGERVGEGGRRWEGERVGGRGWEGERGLMYMYMF